MKCLGDVGYLSVLKQLSVYVGTYVFVYMCVCEESWETALKGYSPCIYVLLKTSPISKKKKKKKKKEKKKKKKKKREKMVN